MRIGAPVAARSRHIWMMPEMFQTPLIFTPAHTVLNGDRPIREGCSPPGRMRRKVKARPGSSALDGRMVMAVIAVVAGRDATSGGEVHTTALLMSTISVWANAGAVRQKAEDEEGNFFTERFLQ